MSAVREDSFIVVVQVREYLLIVVNKEKEIKEFISFTINFVNGVYTKDKFMSLFVW